MIGTIMLVSSPTRMLAALPSPIPSKPPRILNAKMVDFVVFILFAESQQLPRPRLLKGQLLSMGLIHASGKNRLAHQKIKFRHVRTPDQLVDEIIQIGTATRG